MDEAKAVLEEVGPVLRVREAVPGPRDGELARGDEDGRGAEREAPGPARRTVDTSEGREDERRRRPDTRHAGHDGALDHEVGRARLANGRRHAVGRRRRVTEPRADVEVTVRVGVGVRGGFGLFGDAWKGPVTGPAGAPGVLSPFPQVPPPLPGGVRGPIVLVVEAADEERKVPFSEGCKGVGPRRVGRVREGTAEVGKVAGCLKNVEHFYTGLNISRHRKG